MTFDNDIAEELNDYLIYMSEPHTNKERQNIRDKIIKRIKAIVIQSLLENGSKIDSKSLLSLGNIYDL